MSLSDEINTKFWLNPPWGDGQKKYRLGLAPIDKKIGLNLIYQQA